MKSSKKPSNPIRELLTRGVVKIYPSKETLEKLLLSGKKIRLYQGFDPTGRELHVGHMVGLRKLKQWQELGHQVIFLIGDGTGQAGDPSGKKTAREKFFTREQLRKNAVDYVKQAGKIVRFKGKNAAQILFNGDWLNKLTLVDILGIAGNFTLSQLAERDLYRERAKKGKEVNLREFLYPLLQAYDSVAMKVDLEVGGTDQTFNMLMGRHLVRAMQRREKFVMTTPLLADVKGRKIGKSEGNVIALTDKPAELFAKIMALSDDVIVKGFEYLTDVEESVIKQVDKSIKKGENPIIYKKKLAFEIVKQLNNEKAARQAQEEFEKVFSKKGLPSRLRSVKLKKSKMSLVDVLVAAKLAPSKGQAYRLITQGGVEVDGMKISNPKETISVSKTGRVIKAGKKNFVKIV
ncbi:MAG: tyrosine--tRNA ligase [Candidatus Colwellbacteria bacterium]|nr:tyrosine--tRNA ligase [Candidatus Colwellbacteria bacterium]